MTRAELAGRAAMSVAEFSQYERGAAREPRVDRALRLAHSLGVTLDRLTERIYWNPGEVARIQAARRAPSERLAGFFLVLPANVPPFEPAPPRNPVTDRRQAARLFGQNLRDARERRHLSQQRLADAAGLSKSGLSLIERGIHETTVRVLFSLARSLQVEPAALLAGMRWLPAQLPCSGAGLGRGYRHRAGSRDAAIRRLWGEGKAAREIAETVDTSPGAVSAIVHRLRERGEDLPYRSRPTRPADEAARRRRSCQPRRAGTAPEKEGNPSGRVTEDCGTTNASATELAAQIGANVALHRHRRGLTLQQLGEAIELDRTYVHRTERGRHLPQVATVVKLAASLNVRCEAIVAGIAWQPRQAAFRVGAETADSPAPAKRLGSNALKVRREAGLSQRSVAARAVVDIKTVADIEEGSQTVRIFTAIKLAGALDLSPADLLTDTRDFYVRPLPPPQYAPEDCPPTKAERDEIVSCLWREGKSEREIAEALDLTIAAVSSYVRKLRDVGVKLAYRRSPRRPSETAARRGRR